MGSVFQHWAAQSSTFILESSLLTLVESRRRLVRSTTIRWSLRTLGVSSFSVIKAASPSNRRAAGCTGMQNHQVKQVLILPYYGGCSHHYVGGKQILAHSKTYTRGTEGNRTKKQGRVVMDDAGQSGSNAESGWSGVSDTTDSECTILDGLCQQDKISSHSSTRSNTA